MTIFLDLGTRKIYTFPTSLAEGRLPEAFGGWSEGRPLRAGLASLHSGGSGHRAGRYYGRSARCSLDGGHRGLLAARARPPGETGPARRAKGESGRPRKRDADPDPTTLRRFLCTQFKFWHVCTRKACRRALKCSGDPPACFALWWPHVPEEIKILYRAGIKARCAGLSPREAARVATAEV